jgi:deazaflavin-dependent oxidoreductase (nitroreductase family)
MFLPIRIRHSFMRAADRLTQLVYRLTSGLLGERQLKYTILLLETRGRKSGQPRTHALLYVRDGVRYVICASNFGASWHPAWYWNLRAQSQARIQVGRRRLIVSARDAEGEERARLWQRLQASWPLYDRYQAGVSREIPVVILTPVATAIPDDSIKAPRRFRPAP